MPRGRTLASVALIALLLFGAGCATGGGGGRDGQPSIPVTVENRIRPNTSLTVRMTSSGGIRSFLGTVPPGQTRELAFRVASLAGTFRLVAQTAAGQEVQSRPITLVPGSTIFWRLPSNSVSVGVDPESIEPDSTS